MGWNSVEEGMIRKPQTPVCCILNNLLFYNYQIVTIGFFPLTTGQYVFLPLLYSSWRFPTHWESLGLGQSFINNASGMLLESRYQLELFFWNLGKFPWVWEKEAKRNTNLIFYFIKEILWIISYKWEKWFRFCLKKTSATLEGSVTLMGNYTLILPWGLVNRVYKQ